LKGKLPMPDEYLSIAGVNFASVMDDTAQLSVVRGASFLLRDAVQGIAKDFSCCLEPLRTGASIGLFLVKHGCDAKTVRQDVSDWLNQHPDFQHFTFVVDIERANGDLTRTLEALTARNRFRQMRQLSVALPAYNDGEAEPCEWDDLRPGDSDVDVDRDEGPPKVSRSVKVRHDYGWDRKQAFYADEAAANGVAHPVIAKLEYARELDEIADKCAHFPNLGKKLAVIYLDGNGFGKIAREGGPGEFDKTLRGYQSAFLQQFLLTIHNDPDFLIDVDKRRLRIETLLWGGDEVTLVVPAWKGFWALNRFYEHSQDWKYLGTDLTHAGGLVFCHYKTPIYRIRKLAKDLAEEVKEYLKDRGEEQQQNRFEYAILESIDFPTEPLRRFWERRYDPLAECRRPLPCVANWDQARQELGKLLKDRKGQVQSLVEAGRRDPGRGFADQRRRFAEVIRQTEFRELETCVQRLFPGEGCEVWPWIHLLELWDYLILEIPPES